MASAPPATYAITPGSEANQQEVGGGTTADIILRGFDEQVDEAYNAGSTLRQSDLCTQKKDPSKTCSSKKTKQNDIICLTQHPGNGLRGAVRPELAASDFNPCAKPSKPKSTRSAWPRSRTSCVPTKTPGRYVTQEQPQGFTTMYGQSTKSCVRHIRAETTESRCSPDGTNKAAAVETENARKAVRQTKALESLVNVVVARKEVALGVARKRYRRLEADMFRSRMELVDTLSNMERGREKHAEELKDAEKRQAVLEGALHAADEVVVSVGHGEEVERSE